MTISDFVPVGIGSHFLCCVGLSAGSTASKNPAKAGNSANNNLLFIGGGVVVAGIFGLASQQPGGPIQEEISKAADSIEKEVKSAGDTFTPFFKRAQLQSERLSMFAIVFICLVYSFWLASRASWTIQKSDLVRRIGSL